MQAKNPVVHFEMPYENARRVADFYARAFGWDMQVLGQDMGNYILAGTTETDENQMAKQPGNINGGFYLKTPDAPPEPSVVIAVENLAQAMKQVRDAGGKVLGDPIEIPGIGRYVHFTDSERNRVSLLEPTNR